MAFSDFIEFLMVLITSYFGSIYRLFCPTPRKNIEGQVALVTGGGHGIGREISLELSKAGATVVVWDINKNGCEETVELVKQAGGQAHAYSVDVTNTNQIAETAQKMRKDVGEVSILVNNAGVVFVNNFLDMTEKSVRKTFEVNTLAQFWTVREFLPSMLERQQGHIINISSIAAYHACQYMTDYCASKCASRGFSDALRREFQSHEQDFMKVTCVCPCFVATGFMPGGTFEVPKRMELTPQEVASATVDGMLRNKNLVVVPSAWEYFNRIGNLLPQAIHEYNDKNAPWMVRPQQEKID